MHKKLKNFFISLTILGALSALFFIYQISKKSRYNFYEGVVTEWRVGTVTNREYSHRGLGKDVQVFVFQPTVRYVRGTDTIFFRDNNHNATLGYYGVGDTVTVAEEKILKQNSRIYTLLSFVKDVEIIIFLCVWLVLCLCFIKPKRLKKI